MHVYVHEILHGARILWLDETALLFWNKLKSSSAAFEHVRYRACIRHSKQQSSSTSSCSDRVYGQEL